MIALLIQQPPMPPEFSHPNLMAMTGIEILTPIEKWPHTTRQVMGLWQTEWTVTDSKGTQWEIIFHPGTPTWKLKDMSRSAIRSAVGKVDTPLIKNPSDATAFGEKLATKWKNWFDLKLANSKLTTQQTTPYWKRGVLELSYDLMYKGYPIVNATTGSPDFRVTVDPGDGAILTMDFTPLFAKEAVGSGTPLPLSKAEPLGRKAPYGSFNNHPYDVKRVGWALNSATGKVNLVWQFKPCAVGYEEVVIDAYTGKWLWSSANFQVYRSN